jgi:hypothetical protein
MHHGCALQVTAQLLPHLTGVSPQWLRPVPLEEPTEVEGVASWAAVCMPSWRPSSCAGAATEPVHEAAAFMA